MNWLKRPVINLLRRRLLSNQLVQNRRAIALVAIIPIMLASVFLGLMLRPASKASTAVPGQSYLICDQQATYLTSPYTYHALNSGSQGYTVSQYQALPGYGTTLPALPSYIIARGASAQAAVIFAPGANVDLAGYEVDIDPKLYFFEGGSYGILGIGATNGSLYIGGSTTGFPLPVFNNAHQSAGISAQNDSYHFDSNPTLISHTASAVSAGATTVTLSSSTVALSQWSSIVIGSDEYKISAISGSQSGYTVTIAGGVDRAYASGTNVYYGKLAGGVTVSYLDINQDEHNTTGTIWTGAGWTVSHNNFHDGNSAPGQGVSIYGGEEGVIEYNCFSRMGTYAANIFGHNNKFRKNEVFETNYQPDPGCGCSGGGKWWGTLNADITDNAWVNDSPGEGGPIWLDNGNSGTLISGNFFDKSYSSSIHSETGYNLNITNNLFQNSGWGDGAGACGDNCNGQININTSGGFHVPGSRYDNQVTITSNQFINNWEAVSIWQSGARSCENSGQNWPIDASYCSGGFPVTQEATSGGLYYYSHTSDSQYEDMTTTDAAASAGATQVLLRRASAINDYIGFDGDPTVTTTTNTNGIATLSNATINVATTTGFPASGQLRVGTSAAWNDAGGSYSGGVLSYTGKTATSFTGVSYVRGSGTLAGPVREIEPYKVTSQTCYTNDCLVTITPALASGVTAGTNVTNAGTCQLYATAGATPTSPLAPNGVSYWEGCQWGTRNITVDSNTFIVDRAAINASTPLKGTGTMQCDAAHDCGVNFQAYQAAGESPFTGGQTGNAMMSRSSLTGCPSWDTGCSTNPLANINALTSPPDAAAGNGTPTNNITWSNNNYQGPWEWHVYEYGGCYAVPHDSVTNKSMPSDACAVNFTKWQSYWQQDTGSVYSATVTPTPSGTPTPTPTPTPSGTATPTPTPTASPVWKIGDINHDNAVNIFDLSILLSNWGTSNASADLNSDNTVNIFDLSMLLSHWGT